MLERSGNLRLNFLPRNSLGLAGIQGRGTPGDLFLPLGFSVRIWGRFQTIQ